MFPDRDSLNTLTSVQSREPGYDTPTFSFQIVHPGVKRLQVGVELSNCLRLALQRLDLIFHRAPVTRNLRAEVFDNPFFLALGEGQEDNRPDEENTHRNHRD